jgi:hypothetical protein
MLSESATPEAACRARRAAIGQHLLALALYATIAILLPGRALVHGWTRLHLGPAVDSSFLMWALSWWPYALRHGLNPFICRLIWAPAGYNLAWSGGIPLPSLVAAPLTLTAGPVASFNLLCITAFVLAAWCTYALCYWIVGIWWAALFGGYLFGFSSYMLGQLTGGHLNLLLLFPVPLIVLIFVARVSDAIGRRAFVAALTSGFVVQFLCSIELAATVVIFGAIALLLAYALADPPGRSRLRDLMISIATAAILSAIILSPYLYYLFLPGAPHGAINSPGGYSADLVNLLVPTRTTFWGRLPAIDAVARHFPGNLAERDAYFGLPMLLVVAHYGWIRRREPLTHLLIGMLVVVVLCASGPRLRVAGWTGFGMPWKIATHLPLIKSALPTRYMGYAALIVAVIAALWLADPDISIWLRSVAALLIVATTLPNPDAEIWAAPTNIPAFFSQGGYREHLQPGETVVVLPFGIDGDSMLWQAAAGMSFRMAGGYTGITPRGFERWPIVRAFMTGTYIPYTTEQLLAFMSAHDAGVVVVDDAHRQFWNPVLEAFDPSPITSGGVWLYRAHPAILARLRGSSVSAWERCDAEARFAREIVAVRSYMFSGQDPAALSPWRVQQLGFLPPRWVRDHDVRTDNGLYLGPWPGGRYAIGVVGSYDALQPMIEKYRPRAEEVFFPYPAKLEGTPHGDTFQRLLVIVFNPDVLRWDLDNAAFSSHFADPLPRLCD